MYALRFDNKERRCESKLAMASKTLQVLGDDAAGKKTLLGRLIYDCGLELSRLGELERDGIRDYAQIPAYYEKHQFAKSFLTPSSEYTIDNHNTPDTVFWVVDGTASDNGLASSRKLASLISTGVLKLKGKLLILVNKMDLTNWSESSFKQIVHTFSSVELIAGRTFIIPISAKQGTNVVGASQAPSWVKESWGSGIAGYVLVSAEPLVYLLR
ncbi:hypothetical protein F4778DRAFT_762077 [Xylariomycetidae sp. FL2044]|nr:hypothetical protein F4778DRAFT_762077 [Xylariomycetidae sp. FL2044]